MTVLPDLQLVSNVTRWVTFPISVGSKSIGKQSTSIQSQTGYWCGCGRSQNRSRSRDQSRCNIHEAESTQDTSRLIVDSTSSEVDVVKLLQAYGMVSSEGSELRHRKVKQWDINYISVETSKFAYDVNTTNLEPKFLVLHGSPLTKYIDVLQE